jgi:D-sedoheptulose 7-phosphate isomerase
MPINIYNQIYNTYFNSQEFKTDFQKALSLIPQHKKIFFIGNGGSNAICSHMYEDFMKIGGYKTFTFSDAALITCYANDYGYENAMAKWIEQNMDSGDLLIAISSSGNSKNILNAVHQAKVKNNRTITLSGFKADNQLKQLGDINFYIQSESYGIVECFHQVILHSLLDTLTVEK